ncbi:hypothetical protein, partial [Klebsiella variicola]|uniref:hypothetical protein n=1 Tax=Klebsiella variicola TaxID=244366 RepID=UPI001952AD41
DPGHRKDNQHNFADTVYEWTTVGEREASLGIGLDVSNLFVALRVGLSPSEARKSSRSRMRRVGSDTKLRPKMRDQDARSARDF